MFNIFKSKEQKQIDKAIEYSKAALVLTPTDIGWRRTGLLIGLLHGAGFKTGMAVSNGIDMWVNAIKPENQQDFLKKNFDKHLGK